MEKEKMLELEKMIDSVIECDNKIFKLKQELTVLFLEHSSAAENLKKFYLDIKKGGTK